MVKITRVYTRKGDDGRTRNVNSKRVSKHSVRVELFGLLDELNSFLGWANVLLEEEKYLSIRNEIIKIQNTLFDLGAFLYENKNLQQAETFFGEAVKRLENSLDSMNTKLPTLNSFVLPGGSEVSARFHIARAVCRRAECKLVALAEEEKNITAIPYINRLSDWLFVAARYALLLQESSEELWIPCL